MTVTPVMPDACAKALSATSNYPFPGAINGLIPNVTYQFKVELPKGYVISPQTPVPAQIIAGQTSSIYFRVVYAAQDTEVVYQVGPQLVDCQGVAPMKCMVIKETPAAPWTYFYSAIQGFTFEPGYVYTLRILRSRVADPPADAAAYEYKLIQIIQKEPA
jgi:hypothetical protein